MSPTTASEREMFLAVFGREALLTLKVLRAYPDARADLKPAPRSPTAREVAWTLVMVQQGIEPILSGAVEPFPYPPAPERWTDLVAAFEQAYRDALMRLDRVSDSDFNGMVRMPTGPQVVGQVRRGDALWTTLHDSIHHRGQLSVYLRMSGAKVPSIYGPSGDEPWW